MRSTAAPHPNQQFDPSQAGGAGPIHLDPPPCSDEDQSNMGIYDREYYREATRQSGWVTGQNSVCTGLIVANVAVFILQLVSEDRITSLLALHKPLGEHGWQLWTLVTAAFCHGGLFHILWNMLFLWWFGRELERMYGPREFLAFYLTAAVIASMCYLVLPSSNLPMVGASGAVGAVVTVYALYYPRHRIYLYGVFPLEMRFWLLIFVLSALWPMLQGIDGGVAHAAHLGGFAFGLVYKWGDLRLGRLLRRRRVRPKLRVVRPEPPSRSARLEEPLEHQVDRILAKISRQGKESLSEHERDILERASRKLRDRRS